MKEEHEHDKEMECGIKQRKLAISKSWRRRKRTGTTNKKVGETKAEMTKQKSTMVSGQAWASGSLNEV